MSEQQQSKLQKDYVTQFNTTELMLDYATRNFSEIADMDIEFILGMMSQIQNVQEQIKCLELRMREEIIPYYDCEEGKTKTKTDKERGFKVGTKRPVNARFYPKVTDAEFKKALKLSTKKELDDLFPAKRPYSSTSYNNLSETQQKALAELMDVSLGQISVKVVAL